MIGGAGEESVMPIAQRVRTSDLVGNEDQGWPSWLAS